MRDIALPGEEANTCIEYLNLTVKFLYLEIVFEIDHEF
jgi:hypothetical protein